MTKTMVRVRGLFMRWPVGTMGSSRVSLSVDRAAGVRASPGAGPASVHSLAGCPTPLRPPAGCLAAERARALLYVGLTSSSARARPREGDARSPGRTPARTSVVVGRPLLSQEPAQGVGFVRAL